MLNRVCMVIPIAVVLASGCTSSRKLDEMQLQVNVLEQQNRAIEDKLIAQDSLSRSLLDALQTFKARTEFADKAGDARLDEISAKLNDVIDRIERLQQSFVGLQQGLIRAPVASADDSVTDTTQASLTYVDAQKLFDRAFKDMASGNYSLGILGFREYIKTFPTTDLTDDAQFWVGECYYRQGDFNEAAKEYEKVESGFANSDKIASALYKLGRCAEESGRAAQAKEYFDKVAARFPGTQEAELAKQKLQSPED